MRSSFSQNEDNDSLREVLKQNVDKPVPLTVYSTKTQTTRQVSLVPSAAWGGQGLLGVSIRFCSIPAACENVWHVVVRLARLSSLLIYCFSINFFLICLFYCVPDRSAKFTWCARRSHRWF